MEEGIKERSRNVRRGARSTLVFRVCTGIAVLGLLIVLVRLSSDLGEARQEVADLKVQVDTLPAGKLTQAPGNQGDAAEVRRLSATLKAMREELAKSVQDLAVAERAGAAERREMVTEFTRVLGQMGAEEELLLPLLSKISEEDRRRLLTELAAYQPVSLLPSRTPPGPTTEGEGASVGEQEEEEADPTKPDEVPEEPQTEPVAPPEDVPEPVVEPVVEPSPNYVEYKIRRGDTISEIARKYKVSMDELLELNGITDARKIQIDQVLKIPGN